jgi:hypothetical protein
MTAIEPTVESDIPDLAAIVAEGDDVEIQMDMDLTIPDGVVEVRLPENSLCVYFDAKIVDKNGVQPNNIISADDDFYVVWDIWVKGPLWRLICGCWCVDLRLESIGQGEEFSLSQRIGHRKGCGFRCCFHGCRHCHFCHKVCVPGGTIPAGKCSSIYLLAATFQLLDHCGRPAPIVGYENLGAFSFYQPD